jgi:hypothetical protein
VARWAALRALLVPGAMALLLASAWATWGGAPGVEGSVNTTNDSGSASFKIPISGPKGEAVIWLEAERTRKIWTYPTLEVTVKGQPNPIKLTP